MLQQCGIVTYIPYENGEVTLVRVRRNPGRFRNALAHGRSSRHVGHVLCLPQRPLGGIHQVSHPARITAVDGLKADLQVAEMCVGLSAVSGARITAVDGDNAVPVRLRQIGGEGIIRSPLSRLL